MKAESTSFEPTSEQFDDQSDLLARMHADIDVSFAGLWKTIPRSPYRSNEENTEDYGSALTREHAFADRVFAAAHEVEDKASGPITLLFDVDETIVKKYFGFDADSGTDVVRPALSSLVKALAESLGGRCEIGLLTTRGQAHLEQELRTPTYLAGVVDKVNPDFVISSRDGERANHFSDHVYRNHVSFREELGDFLNPGIIKEDDMDTWRAVRAVTNSPLAWDGKKLPILKQLVEEYPDRPFVYVDDAASASVINSEFSDRLATVQVYDDAAFLV